MQRSSHALSKSAALLAFALSGFAPGLALSATEPRFPQYNAAADCQGALPRLEIVFRKRPTGIANEGTSSAFLTCSMQADQNAEGSIFATIAFRNRGAADATVNCTMVAGIVDSPVFYPKSIVVPAGAAFTTLLSWTADDDNDGDPFDKQINFSCSIPPGVEANYLNRLFNEEVGQ